MAADSRTTQSCASPEVLVAEGQSAKFDEAWDLLNAAAERPVPRQALASLNPKVVGSIPTRPIPKTFSERRRRRVASPPSLAVLDD